MPDLTMLNRELTKARAELEILRRELLETNALAPDGEGALGNVTIAASRMREICERIESLTRAILRPSAGLRCN